MSAVAAMKPKTVNYLVIGAGLTGWSVINFLRARQESFRVMDSRDNPPYAEQISQMLGQEDICFGQYDMDWLLNCDVMVLSPGVALHVEEIRMACQHGVEILGDIELFARYTTKPYIAITGSNGKSTVTTLVTDMLNSQGIVAKAGGNIGIPALDLLEDQEADIYVLELSSFQLETCPSLAPEVAVVLNISEDHIDRHQNLAEYTSIKMSIYKNAKEKVFACDDSIPQESIDRDSVSFSLNKPDANSYGILIEQDKRYLAYGAKKLLASDELKILGATGELNALAGLALTHRYVKDLDAALDVLKEFAGLPYRCQVIAEQNGVQWINDSKGTNIGATVAAIDSVNQPLVLILGGIHKGGSLDDLVKAIDERIIAVIVYGRDQNLFAEEINKVKTVYAVDTLEEAILKASSIVTAQQAVLFSPACASFDMFDNYQKRGEVFNQVVAKCLSGICHAG